MKHIKIVLTLTIVVVGAMLAVALVEGPTSDRINANNIAAANAAKYEVFPELETLTAGMSPEQLEGFLAADEEYDTTGTPIEQVIELDGNGVIYIAAFQGYQSTIKYIIGIDTDGNITGYKTLEQGDTPGLGAEIANPDYWSQFTGMTLETAEAGEIDGISGATITTGAWISSIQKVIQFHNVTFSGAVQLTEEEIAREQALTKFGEGYTLSTYTPDTSTNDTGINDINIANDGTNDVAVVYTVEFVGYNENDHITYIIAFDIDSKDILWFETVYANDTAGLGNEIANPDNWEQFEDKTADSLVNEEIDMLAGATVTTDAWKASLQTIGVYHQEEILDIIVMTPAEKLAAYQAELFPSGATFTDVTASKPLRGNILAIIDVFDASDNKLGTMYHIRTMGASYEDSTFLEYVLAIDTSNNFVGFRMFDDNEAEGSADAFYGSTYDDAVEGVSIDTATFDAVAGSTLTYQYLTFSIDQIVDYHKTEYFKRPESIAVDNADLLAALPGAATFESVYEDYDYDMSIGNVYAGKDGSDAIIGYVYYGTSSGFGGTIEFALGVDTNGDTVNITIISHSESWGNAEDFADYDGSEGTFPNTTWLDNFEGVALADLLTSPVDDVSGVSTTTSGIIDVIEAFATYHADQIEGGSN
jgi:RnfABCDGE-type electron transport complex G subunit